MPTEALYDPAWFLATMTSPSAIRDRGLDRDWEAKVTVYDVYFEEEPVASETEIALDKLLATLSAEEREVLELRAGGLLSFRAISVRMGWMSTPKDGGAPYPRHIRARRTLARATEKLRLQIESDPDLMFLIPEEGSHGAA